MPSGVLIGVAVGAACVACLVVADAARRERVIPILKMASSTSFLGTALAAGAFDGGSYGWIMFVALCLCWLGDLLLIGRETVWFLAGLGAFLLGHVVFGVAFWFEGVDWLWVGGALALLAVLGTLIARWLLPQVPDDMRTPVRAYIVVITIMVALAAGAVGAGAHPIVLVGAVLFFVSDLSVALDHFVEPGPKHRHWGWPAYFAAQLCLAGSIALM